MAKTQTYVNWDPMLLHISLRPQRKTQPRVPGPTISFQKVAHNISLLSTPLVLLRSLPL